MNWTVGNLMTQGTDCRTRFKGSDSQSSDSPSRLYSVFSSDPECIDKLRYDFPFSKSDLAVTEILHTLRGGRSEFQEKI